MSWAALWGASYASPNRTVFDLFASRTVFYAYFCVCVSVCMLFDDKTHNVSHARSHVFINPINCDDCDALKYGARVADATDFSAVLSELGAPEQKRYNL